MKKIVALAAAGAFAASGAVAGTLDDVKAKGLSLIHI